MLVLTKLIEFTLTNTGDPRGGSGWTRSVASNVKLLDEIGFGFTRPLVGGANTLRQVPGTIGILKLHLLIIFAVRLRRCKH